MPGRKNIFCICKQLSETVDLAEKSKFEIITHSHFIVLLAHLNFSQTLILLSKVPNSENAPHCPGEA